MDGDSTSGKFMNERTKKGLEILQVALVLGILGDALLRATPWGLNVFLWITLVTVGFSMFVTRNRENGSGTGLIALHAGLIFFALMFVWRDSIQLMVADVGAIVVIFAVLSLPAMKLKMQKSGLTHYALGWVYSTFNSFIAPFLLLIDDIRWKSTSNRSSTKYIAAVLRGLVVAVPALLIFGALFMAADAGFQELIEKTFRIDFELIIGHVMLAGFFSWIVAGYFRGASFFTFSPREKAADLTISPKDLDLKEDEPGVKQETAASSSKPFGFDLQDINNSFLPDHFTLGKVELGIILGLINLLFLSFVIVQVPYLFGGMELVQNTENLKLAEYARRGFGELVLVSALVLPLLLMTHWLIRKENKAGLRLYQVLALVQIGLLFVVMLSAGQRMLLYTGNSGYGLTTMRFYPMAFMIWMAIVFVWFGVTVLRGRRDHFAWGTLWSAMIFLAVLHVFNPDDFIARTNFRLMHAGRSFDQHYMAELSDDAVPAMLQEIPQLGTEAKCSVQHTLATRFRDGWIETDLRSWNWSRWSARNQLRKTVGTFDFAGCGHEGLNHEIMTNIDNVNER